MSTFKSNSNNYNVFPITVHNSNEPWIEICEEEINQTGRTHDYVVIEPVIGRDALDFNSNTSILNGYIITPETKILGSYTAEKIEDFKVQTETPIIVNAVFSCLRYTNILKHAKTTSYTSANKLFMQMIMNKIKNNSSVPHIIINTKCGIDCTHTNVYSEMVKEITSAFVNNYAIYPTIFVAFSDDERLNNNNKKNHKKKKRNK